MRTIPVALGWLFLAAPLAAQEAGEEPTPEAAVPAEATPGGKAAAEPPSEDADRPPSPDGFTPSEEISLDLPVSFPVDI